MNCDSAGIRRLSGRESLHYIYVLDMERSC
jgi:hypothetical protein